MDDNRALRDALDACRPEDRTGAPELVPLEEALASDPEVLAIWERSQRLDTQIAQSFQDIEVPDGLQDRLLSAIRSQAASAATSAPAGNRRRRWLWSAALTAAAALVVAFVVWGRGDKGVSLADLNHAAQAIISESKAEWQTSSPPSEFPLPASVVARGPVPWREVEAAGLPAIAYDLSPQRNGSAVLLVINSQRKVTDAANPDTALPPLPFRPLQGTGGVAIGAWRTPGKIYLLVGRMSKSQLRSFLAPIDVT